MSYLTFYSPPTVTHKVLLFHILTPKPFFSPISTQRSDLELSSWVTRADVTTSKGCSASGLAFPKSILHGITQDLFKTKI